MWYVLIFNIRMNVCIYWDMVWWYIYIVVNYSLIMILVMFWIELIISLIIWLNCRDEI